MHGLVVQLQVIHALIMREIKTRFGTHRLGYVWALVEPSLWILTFAGLYWLMGRLSPPGMDVVPFIATGIVPFLLFRGTSSRNVSAIASNKGLLFYPRIRPLDLAIARTILEFATCVMVFVVLLGAYVLLTGHSKFESSLKILLGLGLAAGLGAGVGMSFAGLSVFAQVFERLHNPLIRPLFWTSAVFYPLNAVPSSARDLLLYNPLVHAVELVRDGWFAGYHSRYINAWYPGLWTLGLLFLGLTVERAARRRLQLS